MEDGFVTLGPDRGELCTCTDHEDWKRSRWPASDTIALVIGIMNSMKENQRM